MLETFLILSILSSFIYLLSIHNKLILVRPSTIPFWCRTIPKILVSVVIAMTFGIQSDLKYAAWFHNLSGVKDYIYLGFASLGILLTFIVRQSTIDAQINPFRYNDNVRIGSIHKIDMKIPIILNILMYFWLLSIPTFPFLNILVLSRK